MLCLLSVCVCVCGVEEELISSQTLAEPLTCHDFDKLRCMSTASLVLFRHYVSCMLMFVFNEWGEAVRNNISVRKDLIFRLDATCRNSNPAPSLKTSCLLVPAAANCTPYVIIVHR
jgi:hypothetical protein